MHRHSIDHLKEDGHERGLLVNRSFWIHGIPRPLITCRLRGHKPIVDGTEGFREGDLGSRWVCCDRCGDRPNPQGSLDPATWNIGDPYTGPFSKVDPEAFKKEQWQILCAAKRGGKSLPGPWPTHATWDFGGQAILGRHIPGVAADVKVGNAGSEHTLAAHIRLNPIGALYLNTERLGTWLQRRLNPVGYDSRVISIDIADGRIRWQIWAKRDEWSRGTPRWQDGSVVIDPRDRLLGPRRYTYEDSAGPVTGTVRMPEGDEHEVTLTLKLQRHGRPRARRATFSWLVHWESTPGIPFRKDSWKGDETFASGVPVTRASVEANRWHIDACAAIAAKISRDRSRYGYRPPTTAASA